MHTCLEFMCFILVFQRGYRMTNVDETFFEMLLNLVYFMENIV